MNEEMLNKKKLLREKAELIISNETESASPIPAENLSGIIHDLRVHQVELEMQNEELRSTQNELVNARDGFARLFNNAPAGYLMLNESGIIMMANATFLKMSCRDEESITGKSFAEFLPSPEREIFLARWKAFYKNPAGKDIEARIKNNNNYIYVRMTGRPEPAGLMIQAGISLSSGLLLIVIDITAQVIADDAARHTELKFRQLAENISETFWLRDRTSGKMEYVSPAYEQMWGRSCESLYSDPQSFIDNIHPEDTPEVIKKQREMVIEGRMFSMDYRINRGDGETRWIRARTYPVTDSDGVMVRYAGIAEDITSQKESADRISSLLADRDLLLKEVHHRIKNNMNTVANLLYLQAEKSTEEKVSSALLDAQSRILSMMVIYDRLYRSDDFRYISIIDYFTNFFIELSSALDITGRISINTDMDDITLDSSKIIPLGIIVNELVTNSVKYAFKKNQEGIITVGLKKNSGGGILLSVKDNGIGLPENFSAADSSGFGMSLVNLLVEQLNAKLEIFSETGAEFRIIFKN